MTPRGIARNSGGALLLARREHVTWSKPGTTHGAYAHHVSIDGASACSGALLADGTFEVWSALLPGQRCQRTACRNRWMAEEIPAGPADRNRTVDARAES